MIQAHAQAAEEALAEEAQHRLLHVHGHAELGAHASCQIHNQGHALTDAAEAQQNHSPAFISHYAKKYGDAAHGAHAQAQERRQEYALTVIHAEQPKQNLQNHSHAHIHAATESKTEMKAKQTAEEAACHAAWYAATEHYTENALLKSQNTATTEL